MVIFSEERAELRKASGVHFKIINPLEYNKEHTLLEIYL
jgi:hypothetical protein